MSMFKIEYKHEIFVRSIIFRFPFLLESICSYYILLEVVVLVA